MTCIVIFTFGAVTSLHWREAVRDMLCYKITLLTSEHISKQILSPENGKASLRPSSKEKSSSTLQNALSFDLLWMRRALGLAEKMRGHVWPNPPVGCVIVKEGVVVAEAATHPGGRPHAERKALDKAGDLARGATLYVTLEPCCHWGKTPPCTDAILESGITRVVCAIQDPDPRVNGGGFETLRRANVELNVGLCSDEAQRLMSGFFHRVRTGVPELIAMPHTTFDVPSGTDALLVSTETGTELTTRVSKTKFAAQPIHRLLRGLGDFGLTTIAIPHSDAMWQQLPEDAAAMGQSVQTKQKNDVAC